MAARAIYWIGRTPVRAVRYAWAEDALLLTLDCYPRLAESPSMTFTQLRAHLERSAYGNRRSVVFMGFKLAGKF